MAFNQRMEKQIVVEAHSRHSARKGELLVHATTWMKCNSIMLGERSQSPKATCGMITFTCILKKPHRRDSDHVSGSQAMGWSMWESGEMIELF